MIFDFLNNLDLFKWLSQDELEKVSGKMIPESFADGDRIIRRGDPGDFISFIRSGSVNVVVPDEGRIASLGQGDFVGEMSLLTGNPRSADVIADGEVRLYTLRKNDFDALVEDHPPVLAFLTDVVASRLGSDDDALFSRSVGTYRILREIGRGGMGIVYQGLDDLKSHYVAIKMLPHEFAGESGRAARFKREAGIISRLDHKDIVKLHELVEAYGTYFIVMEYVRGQSIMEVIKSSGPFPIDQAREIILKIGSALSFAHDMGIVHRDVKPANIMSCRHGEIKLMDFGIARAEGAAALTSAGIRLGSPNYMAPEQVIGEGVDRRTDIYSFGCVCYEVLTGKTPFWGDDPFSVAYKHLKEPVRPPKKLRPEIPDDLNRFIMATLVKNRENRVSTLNNLEEQLQRLSQREEHPTNDETCIMYTAWDEMIDTCFSSGEEFFKRGAYGKAIGEWSKILAINPHDDVAIKRVSETMDILERNLEEVKRNGQTQKRESTMKGYVQVYTGSGKGKTTAALGLALRAAGAGLRVYIAQFVKGMKYHELDSLKTLSDYITVKQYGRDCFISKDPDDEDIRCAQGGLKEVRQIMCSEDYDIIILDEANIATYYRLFSVEDLLDFIKAKPDSVELVITGRKADRLVLEAADLVTEMNEVKHYYQEGVEARDGIER
ncbi:MAG: cob(I)yrinic acid a,c-diamide adenosyltransferase [Desulfatiglans sp.]|jgi:cob(I)alamin adenosyltransferase|nr:cob(I)yrinic acid a,c-diamide adenosyltransferase [Thermodesulfobacteriota bacterium]MEE4351403.1 cob(I)yrinic acid a,c-diamide adenosyltransferase [Desulfatiglans sp.]